MKKDSINWVEYKKLPDLIECDFHDGPREGAYWEFLESVHERVQATLLEARETAMDWVLFTHGSSTSRSGMQTARSIVRKFFRSSEATPLVIRSECVQLPTVFLARVRPTVDWAEKKEMRIVQARIRSEEAEVLAREKLPELESKYRGLLNKVRWKSARLGLETRFDEILSMTDPCIQVEKFAKAIPGLEDQSNRKVGIFGPEYT